MHTPTSICVLCGIIDNSDSVKPILEIRAIQKGMCEGVMLNKDKYVFVKSVAWFLFRAATLNELAVIGNGRACDILCRSTFTFLPSTFQLEMFYWYAAIQDYLLEWMGHKLFFNLFVQKDSEMRHEYSKRRKTLVRLKKKYLTGCMRYN